MFSSLNIQNQIGQVALALTLGPNHDDNNHIYTDRISANHFLGLCRLKN